MTHSIEHGNIEWDIVPISYSNAYKAAYCADGDGIVQVYATTKGRFKVSDQGDNAGYYDTLEQALNKAIRVLKKHYPAIYESVCFED